MQTMRLGGFYSVYLSIHMLISFLDKFKSSNSLGKDFKPCSSTFNITQSVNTIRSECYTLPGYEGKVFYVSFPQPCKKQ